MGSGCFVNEDVNIMKVRHRVGIFQNNVCGSAVQCCPAAVFELRTSPRQVCYNPNNRLVISSQYCPASSAAADYAAAVFPSPSSCFALRRAKRVRSSIHLLRNWLAEAKSRLCRDEDWWAMRASPEFFNYAENLL